MGFQSAPDSLCGCWIGELEESAVRALVWAEVEAGDGSRKGTWRGRVPLP